MATPEEVLADNLREALAGLQKMLLLGTAAAIAYMLLAMAPPAAPTSPGVSFAVMASLMVALVAGAMAYVGALQAQRVAVRLRRSTALHNAVVTFPSVATLPETVPRLFFAGAPGVMLSAGTYLAFVTAQPGPTTWALAVLVSLPYLALVVELKRPLQQVSLAGI